MADALRELAERMNRSRTIGFIGAGYSARSGYPTWSTLIDDLYERAKRFSDDLPKPQDADVDMRWLAEMYANELTRRGSLTDTLRESFENAVADSEQDAQLDRLQLMVARLPFRHYITTNYDALLEQACDSIFEVIAQRPPTATERCLARDGRVDSQFSDFLGALADDRQSVLHLHGRLDGDQLTLSMGEYDKQYLHDAMLLRMFSIFATSTVVFIGASMYDADMMELLRRSTFHTNGRIRHYAFLPADRARDYEMMRTSFGVEPIFYDVPEDDPSDHSELELRLERLLELVEAGSTEPKQDAHVNITPVRADYGEDFDEVVEDVKDEIRKAVRGPASFVMPRERGISSGGVAGSRVLRRVAADYHELPTTYRFRHRVWLSPGRIGLFPGERSRRVVDAILGEVAYSLGRHRATATADRHQNIRAISKILGDVRWHPEHEPALFVIDGSQELREGAGDDEEWLTSLLYALPDESVAIFESSERADSRDDGDWPDPPDWARDDFDAALDGLFAGESELDGDLSRTNEQRLLVALCVVATPISSDQLTTILDMDKHEIEQTIKDLRTRGLIESPPRPSVPDDVGLMAPYDELPEPEAVDVGLLNPVRKATLDLLFPRGRAPKQVLLEVVETILGWAEGTIERLGRWEDDKAQLDELIDHLPNLLAVFEAGCWIGSAREHLTQETANLRLWLGTDLAYILYSVGRWAETGQIVDYLLAHSEAVTEPETFRREVLVLMAAFHGHAGRSAADLAHAVSCADDAIRLADVAADRGRAEVEEPGETIYAPVRLTPERQRARAQLWRAHARLRGLANTDDSALAAQLDTICEAEQDLAAICKGTFDTQCEQDESRNIVADASLTLGELRVLQRRAALATGASPDDSSGLPRALVELDMGKKAAELVRCRPRGYQARLRGELLLQYGNRAAARRCFARALLISHEFQDRYLEGAALLGLAQCDRQAMLATRAAGIFTDLGRTPETKASQSWSWSPRLNNGAGPALRGHPNLVVIVGVPGSGKSAGLAATSSTLASWGFDPVRPRFAPRLLERIRSEEELDLSKVSKELKDLHLVGTSGQHGRVVLVKIPTGRLSELFTPWLDYPDQMRSMLCLHVTAPPDVLVARNEQRRSGQIPENQLQRMIEADASQQPSDGLTWESWFQHHQSAYVRIDGGVPIIEFDFRVRDALALSFLPVEQLLDAYRPQFEAGRATI
ncbi:MAG: hypothetical protein HKN44_08920 [Ilumatobacter sp.]|nr:hypothetical protein [Ilumatobacter sp.]